MPKITSYTTISPANATGSEFAVIINSDNNETHKINVKDWIEYMSSDATEVASLISDHETTYVHGDIAHTNRSYLDAIDQDLGVNDLPSFAEGNFIVANGGNLWIRNDETLATSVWYEWGNDDWKDIYSVISISDSTSIVSNKNGFAFATVDPSDSSYSTFFGEMSTSTGRSRILHSNPNYAGWTSIDFDVTATKSSINCYRSLGTNAHIEMSVSDTTLKFEMIDNTTQCLLFDPNTTGGSNYVFNTVSDIGDNTGIFVVRNDDTDIFIIYGGGGIWTGAPSGGSSATWKLGNYVNSGGGVYSGEYLQVEINGVPRKILVVT